MAGKGDTYRPVNKKVYNENYDHIFRKTTLLVTEANVDAILKFLKINFNYTTIVRYNDKDQIEAGIERPDKSLVVGYGISTKEKTGTKILIESCQNAVNELGLKDEES
jgi:hypothetical protein